LYDFTRVKFCCIDSWQKARLLSLSKSIGLDSPECPYVDAGVRFKDVNLRHCFARCLDLVDDKAQESVKCSYTPDTLRSEFLYFVYHLVS
jgi:hypothetical protein